MTSIGSKHATSEPIICPWVICMADAGAAPVKRASGALDAIDAAGTPGVLAVDGGTGTAAVLLLYCVSNPVLAVVNVALSSSLSLPLPL
jgi:hypothetical protein